MTFLNPLALIALAAAALPLVLHMLSRRRARKVDFSSLRFLRELERSSMSRLRLREILLLILRTALILLIVFAFARPASQGYVHPLLASVSGSATYAPASIVIAIDNSPSMMRHDQNGELFNQAKEVARRITTLATERDELSLVTLTRGAINNFPRASHSPNVVREAIKTLDISPHFSAAADAMRLAASILSTSHNANKEIYLITDGTKATFDSIETLRGMFPAETKFFPVTLRSTHTVNVGIDTAFITTNILEPGGMVEVEVVLHNYSDDALSSRTVSLLLGSRRAAQRAVDLEAHRSARVTLSARIEEIGWIDARVEIEPDDALYDNIRSLTFFVPEKTNVLVVSSSRDESVFLETALAQSATEGKQLFSVRTVAPGQVGSIDLTGEDAVILVDALLSRAEQDRILSYTRDGGGLIIFAGDRLAKEKNILSQCGIISGEVIEDEVRTLHATILDRTHPLFQGVFAMPDGQLDLPRVRRVVKTSLAPIISLSNGVPLVGEARAGTGKIIFCGVVPTPAWSDLPLSSIFLPLVVRATHYVSTTNERTVFSVDEEISINVPSRIHNDASLVIKGSDSEQVIVRPRVTSSGNRIITLVPSSTGISRIVDMKTNNVLSAFATNIIRRESDPETLDNEALRAYARSLGIENDHIITLDSYTDIENGVRQTRYGAELWKLALILAALVALAEMIVARGIRRTPSV